MIFTNLIETNLRTKKLGKQIEYYQRIDSTNKEAWEIIDLEDITHGTIVITDNQLSGKGRNGNTWFMSPSKGLAMSIILKQSISIQDGLLIPIAAGAAIAKALENRGGNPKLKWPNDILINNEKISGIISEIFSIKSDKYINTGFGVNIVSSPKIENYPTTNINKYNKEINNFYFVYEIMEEYFKNFKQLLNNHEKIMTEYKSRLL